MKKIALMPVPDGHKVKIVHVHKQSDLEGLKLENSKRAPRYVTYAILLDADGMVQTISSAACSPKDTPSRKMGRAIAHNRAIKEFSRQAEYAS